MYRYLNDLITLQRHLEPNFFFFNEWFHLRVLASGSGSIIFPTNFKLIVDHRTLSRPSVLDRLSLKCLQMSRILPPFDDTVQLDDMPVDISDTSPIVRNNDIAESHVRTPDVEVVAGDISKHRAYFMVFVLLFINLLNYMDRFTIAGLFPNLHVSSFLTLQYL